MEFPGGKIEEGETPEQALKREIREEFGEGVDRMYLEMKEAGLPEPEYHTEAFMVYATIRNKNSQATSMPQVCRKSSHKSSHKMR